MLLVSYDMMVIWSLDLQKQSKDPSCMRNATYLLCVLHWPYVPDVAKLKGQFKCPKNICQETSILDQGGAVSWITQGNSWRDSHDSHAVTGRLIDVASYVESEMLRKSLFSLTLCFVGMTAVNIAEINRCALTLRKD